MRNVLAKLIADTLVMEALDVGIALGCGEDMLRVFELASVLTDQHLEEARARAEGRTPPGSSDSKDEL